MQTKALLYGLTGFFIGGFIVAVAATTFDKPSKQKTIDSSNSSMISGMQMSVQNLQSKTGDAYDAAFITEMIAHHEGAVAMAKLSATNAKHDEIKKLSTAIITAQEKEIAEMKQWQQDWGYSAQTDSMEHGASH